MDFDSPDPDVEKDFPGLYASDSGGSRKKDDEDCKNFWPCFLSSFQNTPKPQLFSFSVSDGDHEKVKKKEILLGRRKDKKDKKDKGYAALGESSQEEELDAK